MATHLDLEEQEQLDQLKHFWNRYGNVITWVLVLALAGYGGWNGWNWWKRDQAAQASGIYDELERVAAAGDVERVSKVFGDLKARFPGTAFAEQGGLLAARTQFDKGRADEARASLAWVAEHAGQEEYRAVARLRLAGLLLEAQQPDEALKQLGGTWPAAFEPLAADRRGDVLLSQGKKDEARAAYQTAWKGLEATLDYRRLVEAKLTALGAAPEAPVAAAGTASGAQP
jgi:predicted negative regulator of RcsB-dependent stress response